MSKSLTDSGKSGMFWSFLIQGGTQIINFVVTVILARLLLPAEFGLIGMIAIFVMISQALVDGGFASSLIRTSEADNVDYSTVFFVNLFSSVVLYGSLFVLAPFVSEFFNEGRLTDLIRVQGLVLIISGSSTVQSVKLSKKLDFKTQFKLQIPSLIISAFVSIVMAYNEFGVWSLVVKDIAFAFFSSAQLWWYSKWIPSFVFNKEKLKRHFNFGYKLSLTSIIDSSFNNLYNIIIGKYFSAAQLGFYTRARSLEQLPSGFFFNAFNRVFFPLLAQLNNNDAELKKIYSTLIQIVFFVVTPILIYLGVVATPFFRWLLTEKWLPAVPFFQLLVISGIFYPIHQYNLNICNLKGRSDMVLKLSMLYNLLLFAGAFTAIWFGIYGLLFSLIFVNVLITCVNAYFSGELINYGLKEQFKDLTPILGLNLLLAMLFYWLQITWFYKMNDFLNMILVAVGFFLLYVLIAFGLQLRVTSSLMMYIKKK